MKDEEEEKGQRKFILANADGIFDPLKDSSSLMDEYLEACEKALFTHSNLEKYADDYDFIYKRYMSMKHDTLSRSVLKEPTPLKEGPLLSEHPALKVNIYLDSKKTPSVTLNNPWIICRDYQELHIVLMTYSFNQIALVSLGHDLHNEQIMEYYRVLNTKKKYNYKGMTTASGLSCAISLTRYMARNKRFDLKIMTHTYNEYGAKNIIKHINEFKEKNGADPDCEKWEVPWELK